MDKEGVLAAVSILVLSGVLVYGYRHARGVQTENHKAAVLSYEAGAAQQAIETEILAGGTANAYNNGAAIYVAATPYLFQDTVGNVIPSASVNNVPFATQGLAIS